MKVPCSIRFNMTGSEEEPELCSLRYRAVIDIAEYADQNGFSAVNFEEHHCASNAWLPSPLTLAAAAAARTDSVQIGVMALLVTLYDPVRLAEDLAVLDLLSEGRLTFIAGMGYREIEFHALDKPWKDRGKWMDHVLDTLLTAWTGEPFDYRGQQVLVRPKPYTQPHPTFLVGGMSVHAARRAARFGLPFAPPSPMPDLESAYYHALEEHGKQGFVYRPREGFSCLFIDQDPDAAWEELGPYFLNEAQEYAGWSQPGLSRPMEMSVKSVSDLRASGMYEIITPQECIDRHQSDPEYQALLHPLCGGVPVQRGWDCVRLYREQVLGYFSS